MMLTHAEALKQIEAQLRLKQSTTKTLENILSILDRTMLQEEKSK